MIEPYGQIPALKPNFEEAEQATAFSYACSTQSTRPPLKPVSTADLQYALKVRIKKFNFLLRLYTLITFFQIYKNLVSNHTIYATNMERLYTYATHPTWEDLEAKKLLCQSLT